jgi:hypothetical protein
LDALAAIDALPYVQSQETCIATQDYTKDRDLPYFESPPASFMMASFDAPAPIEDTQAFASEANATSASPVLYQEICFGDEDDDNDNDDDEVVVIARDDTVVVSGNAGLAENAVVVDNVVDAGVEDVGDDAEAEDEEDAEDEAIAFDFTLSPPPATPPTPTPSTLTPSLEQTEVIDLTLDSESEESESESDSEDEFSRADTVPPSSSAAASSSSSIVWLSADRRPLKRVIEFKSNGRKRHRVYYTRGDL